MRDGQPYHGRAVAARGRLLLVYNLSYIFIIARGHPELSSKAARVYYLRCLRLVIFSGPARSLPLAPSSSFARCAVFPLSFLLPAPARTPITSPQRPIVFHSFSSSFFWSSPLHYVDKIIGPPHCYEWLYFISSGR